MNQHQTTQEQEYSTSCFELFMVFLKLGPSTFGGGYAMLAAIEREIVDNKKWMHSSEMADMISVVGSAPGGVAVNAATFIGYRLKGVLGAIMAVVGITLPTFVIVFCLSIFGMMFKDVPKVEAALKGVHAAIVALILIAAYKMFKSSIFDVSTLIIAGMCIAILLFTSVHSLYLVLGGPIVGVLVIAIKAALGMNTATEKLPAKRKQDMTYPEYYI